MVDGSLLADLTTNLAKATLFPELTKGEAGFAKLADVPASLSAELKGLLADRLGEILTVRVNQVLSPDKMLLEIAGTELIAKGSAPPGTTGLLEVRLESVEPFIQLGLLDEGAENLPHSLRQILKEVVAKPNLFSGNLLELKELLLDKTLQLPPGARRLLEDLSSRFSADTLINNLRSGTGLALDKLGLLHEPELVNLLLTGTEKELQTVAGRKPVNVKEILLHLLAELEEGPLAKSLAKSGTRGREVADKLQTTLTTLRDMVEINQTLNNPGLRCDGEMLFLLPFFGDGGCSDLWLRLTKDGGTDKNSGSNLYTLMIYLDFEALGPLGAQLVVGTQELQAKIFVVGEDTAQVLRKMMPSVRKQLREEFSKGLHLQVETIGLSAVEEFRQRAFLASLPPLLTASG